MPIRRMMNRFGFLASCLLHLAVDHLPLRPPFFPPRDDRLWVFGARGGEAFADNAKYLYLYAVAEHPDVRAVWLSKDRDVVEMLQGEGYEAYHACSPRGVTLTLRAGVVFLTQGHRDVAMPATAGAFVVNLWHGIPLKHIAWDAEFPDEPLPVRLGHRYMARHFDLVTVPGERAIPSFVSGLGVDRDRVAVVGYPRTDVLVRTVPGSDVGLDLDAFRRVRELAERSRVLLYLPTYRDDGPAVAEAVDFAALDDLMADLDAHLIVKAHPKERLDLSGRGFSRVISLPEETDVYPFLALADALLTDYSSVYLDYLLLDRPVVFYAYDLEGYRAGRGFYHDYDEVTPGPVAREFDDLCPAIGRVFEADDHAAERAALRDDFVAQPAGIASQQVCDIVSGRLREQSAR